MRFFPYLLLTLVLLAAPAVYAQGPVQSQDTPPSLGGCPVLPADNTWNIPVDSLPVDPNSAAYVATIGSSRPVHADFGSGTWEGAPIGIPFVTVPAGQPLVPINISPYAGESDPGPYPVPPTAPVEGAPNTGGDRHTLVVRQGECVLYELYRAFKNADNSWNAESAAKYDLNSNALRQAGWTSADAAGLPILPGLVRYDEVAAGAINHAIRFTVPQTRRAYVWPARHFASSLTGAQYPPMGQRFRLKAGFDISPFSPEVRVILVAMKKYGLILADNGSAWYISGAPDERWDNDMLHELERAGLRGVHGSDFEAVDVSSLQVSANSGQVYLSLTGSPAARAIEPDQTTTYQVSLAKSSGFNAPVTLQVGSPSGLVVAPTLTTLNPPTGTLTLSVTDAHAGPGGWFYTLPLTATGGGLTRTASLRLLVGGETVELPVIMK